MLISKYTDRNGNTNISIVISKKMLHDCKNSNYVRFTIGQDYKIGLDEKTQVTFDKVFKVSALKDNTKAE